MSISAARESFSQPFPHASKLAAVLDANDAVDPVHLVACHRGVTEQQAIRQLGFPDATIVPRDFGVYVADDTQGIQILFLQECRTDAAIKSQVDAALDWLDRAQEDEPLLRRAALRADLVRLVDRRRRSWSSAVDPALPVGSGEPRALGVAASPDLSESAQIAERDGPLRGGAAR